MFFIEQYIILPWIMFKINCVVLWRCIRVGVWNSLKCIPFFIKNGDWNNLLILPYATIMGVTKGYVMMMEEILNGRGNDRYREF